MYLVRFLLRPFGYLAFVVALLALSGAARLLGETHELGFFAGRLARTVCCSGSPSARSIRSLLCGTRLRSGLRR
jgi:hypothetical protein